MIEAQTVYKYFSSNIMIAKSQDVACDDMRLNAGYYEIRNSIEVKKEIEFFPLANIASVVFPGIFKRTLVENNKYGIKFLTTSDIMMLEPDTEKFLSIQLTSNLEIYMVFENTILVSRSGSIGNTIYVDERIKDFAVTEDALRVIPFQITYMGLLYFYFTSEFGSDLITGKKSGAVIDHIYEDDLLKLKIPNLGNEICKQLNDAYLKVKKNREDAHELIIKARLLVDKYNNLPSLEEEKIESIDPSNKTQILFTNLSDVSTDYRLDSHFYNPIAKEAIENIRNKSTEFRKLKDNIADKVFYLNRFTRTFVEEGFGIPYMAGKDIIKIRPTDVAYLSYTETSGLDDYKLKTGWILMTCSGTLGRTCFIYKNYENWVGTHDLIRIVSKKDFDSGYLYAFLSSDYGYYQALKFKHGAVIDHLTPEQVEEILIPIPTEKQQIEIGNLVRQAYDLRAEAIGLEDEAQTLLTHALTKE